MYNLTDINTVKSILTKHNFHFSKSLGQNFIINPDICPRMALESGLSEEYGAVEIGPGIGVLTSELCRNAKKVVALELDSRLLPILEDTLSDYDNLKIIPADALKTDFGALIAEEFPGMPVILCANLPYYLTSPMIMKLLSEKPGFESICVMVQKEAADRICAPVGSKDAGAITVAVNYYSEPEKLFNVSKSSYMPAPKVDSSVISLKIRSHPPVETGDEEFFFAVVKAAFGQRRKTAENSLSAGLGIPKAVISRSLVKCGLSPTVRAEILTMEQFAALAKAIKEENK